MALPTKSATSVLCPSYRGLPIDTVPLGASQQFLELHFDAELIAELDYDSDSART